MAILDELTDAVLRECFDPLTLHRARAYVAEGRVAEPRITSMGETHLNASAAVAGSRPAPYRVQLSADTDSGGLWLMTSCSCPVRSDCKHGAALALTLAHPGALAAPGQEWESELRGLITQLADEVRPDSDLTPLALEVSLNTSRSAYAQTIGVRIRPLRRGARGRWVKTGADWPDLARAIPGRDFPRDQLRPMQELARALQQERLYWFNGAAVPLDDFGAHAADLVRAVAEGGVTLLAGQGIAGVEIFDEPLVLGGEARRADGVIALRFGLSDGERLRSGPTVLPLGNPAHSVAVLDAGTLRLGRLDRRLTKQAEQLVTSAEPLRVPAKEADRLGALLGPLARLVPVHSPDDSVEVPETPPPVLHLTVTWESSSRATLVWEWGYAGRRYPLASRDDLGVVRDADAEAALRGSVPAELLAMKEAEGGDALALAIHDLPALREIKDVEVTEVERPDFRESEEAPEISFDLVEPAGADHTDWLDLEVVITVDGEPVPLPDVLAALTKGADYLVLPSGLYLSTARPEFARLREVVEAAAQLHESDGDRIGVGKTDLGVWAELAELGVVDSQAAEWVAKAQALRDLVELPRPDPVGLATELRSYQRDGFWWLSFLHDQGLGGILADDMGLGKTLEVLAVIAHAVAGRDPGAPSGPFLVVAPTSVVPSWQAEAARHTPGLRVAAVTRRTDDVAALAADADLVVTTYALLRLEQESFAALPWSGLVLDEAQQVKNHQSKTYAAARRVDAPFRLAVTGTPFENRLMELWSLLSIVAPGLYPHPRAFRDQVVTPVEKEGDERALARFRTRIRPFLLRRSKELVAADLPAKQEQILTVELSAQHRKVYDAHLAKERQRILHLLDDFDENRVAILSALTRLRQLALDPGLVDDEHEAVGSAKLDTLTDHLLEITAEGHRALVFSQFTSFLRRARERLTEAGIATTYLDGATRDRGDVVERFRAGEAPVFLISLKAGGVGLTLTEADYVFVLDPWWNPAAEAQAVDRAHRIGQTEHVMVYRLVSGDTIEEKVMELKGRKAELFARVVDGEGLMSGGVEADDIRRLFAE